MLPRCSSLSRSPYLAAGRWPYPALVHRNQWYVPIDKTREGKARGDRQERLAHRPHVTELSSPYPVKSLPGSTTSTKPTAFLSLALCPTQQYHELGFHPLMTNRASSKLPERRSLSSSYLGSSTLCIILPAQLSTHPAIFPAEL